MWFPDAAADRLITLAARLRAARDLDPRAVPRVVDGLAAEVDDLAVDLANWCEVARTEELL